VPADHSRGAAAATASLARAARLAGEGWPVTFSARIERVRSVLANHGVIGVIRIIRDRGRPREYVVYCRGLEGTSFEADSSDVNARGARGLASESRGRRATVPGRSDRGVERLLLGLARRSAGRHRMDHHPFPVSGDRRRRSGHRGPLHESGLTWPRDCLGAHRRRLPAARAGILPRRVRHGGGQNTGSRRAFERSGVRSIGQFTLRGWLRRPARTSTWLRDARAGGSS
jgi:hypothetical protein